MAIAAQLSGEIVSVDSMQVYRGMDIGTAKKCVKYDPDVITINFDIKAFVIFNFYFF